MFRGEPMNLSLEALWKMSDVELLATYYDARRQHVERKFARDTQRARLDWLKAKLFTTTLGGVTERRNAVDAAEDLARKGQELREMTRDLELLRADVAVIAMLLRLRGALAPSDVRTDESSDSENKEEGA
jgi:hypothetical protein